MSESDSIYGLYADGDISYPDPTAPHYSDREWDEIVDAWDANIDWQLAIGESELGQSGGGGPSSPRTGPRLGWAEAVRLGRERGEVAPDDAWGPTRFDSVEWEWGTE